jgi:predicted nucleic acid-binding protein
MMNPTKRLRLYLDTTIPSYVYALDSVERMEITRRFMRARYSPAYEMVISEVVLWEIEAASEPKKALLLTQVEGLPVLPMTPEADRLAVEYIRRGILPPRSINDARHVALATLNGVDALVSWNFGHLVNIRRSKGINELNKEMELPAIEIITPEEVLE